MLDRDKLLRRIVINPRVMVGKPVIKGTRLTVDYILRRLAQGATQDALLQEYPGLTRDDIQACLLFATEALESTTFVPLATEATR
jgi:uncharacterized protein (DUF433 family)